MDDVYNGGEVNHLRGGVESERCIDVLGLSRPKNYETNRGDWEDNDKTTQIVDVI